jgi:hypothetical protein
MDNSASLKERVLYFIGQQPRYNSETIEEIAVTNNDHANWCILYGESIDVGIVGMGETGDDAFDDFIKKWYLFKGFETDKENKSCI